MTGNWGKLECPHCGEPHPPPARAACECEELIADLVCPRCHKGWEVRVELWRYWGIKQELPSRSEDR